MKRNYFLLTLTLFLSLSSCVPVSSQVETKEIPVFDIDMPVDSGDSPADLEEYQVGTIKPLFKEEQEYIPYLTFEQYASLFNRRLMDDARSVITNTSSTTTWQIFVGNNLYFYSAISYLEKMVIKAGDISNAFKQEDDPTETKALSFALQTSGQSVQMGEENYETYSFADISLTRFYFENAYYYPLGFLDLTYSDASSIYHYYNYYGVYETREVEYFAEKEFVFENKTQTVDSQMSNGRNHISMPVYLINYNANMFLYTMDNFYGLKRNKGITTMKQFLKANNAYNDLFSTNDFIRGCAYYTALGLLDDGHTAMISTNDTWGEEDSGSFFLGEITRNRGIEYRELLKVRDNQASEPTFLVEDGVRYSDSGKTALIIFNSFSFGKDAEVFNTDNSLKADAHLYDTYLKIVRDLKAIKSKNTVENVILDISLNGGGTLGVMMKLLALISKDNNAITHFYDDSAKYLYMYDIAIDSNFDNNYEVNDAFGNDFNFYIATSAASFSAANAYAFYADISDSATIIGRKSGGGECAVSIHYLPNSQYIYHSSNLHIGFYDETEGNFWGDEAGVVPEIYFDDYNTYGDPNAIETLIG